MNIYLIGYMASGKTLIGSELAQILQCAFYDLDQCIIEYYGQSVAEIFQKEGESGFRQKESKILQSLQAKKNAIISCGGGTFCFPDNQKWIKSQGISVYLKVSVPVLADRLSGNQEKRPIIKANNASRKDLLQFIEQHLSKRENHYEQADIVYFAEDQPAEIVRELALYFKRFLPQ